MHGVGLVLGFYEYISTAYCFLYHYTKVVVHYIVQSLLSTILLYNE